MTSFGFWWPEIIIFILICKVDFILIYDFIAHGKVMKMLWFQFQGAPCVKFHQIKMLFENGPDLYFLDVPQFSIAHTTGKSSPVVKN